MIVYLMVQVQFHGLELRSQKEVDDFIKTIRRNLKPMSADRFESDLEVELLESAGALENS